ncbi:MAG: hypothetical protein IT285_00565 [Bdellovibrionales bacterium]|nr:hypothetical protein [Bdellovibrionales bacterium]
MKRVVLITGHYFESKRKAGFHWLAEAFWKAGWDVTFFTSALSPLSRLRLDYRMQYPVLAEANQLKPVRDRLTSFVWYTPWHPANLRLAPLNLLASPLFARYGELPLGPAEERFAQADLVIFESNPALLLFDRVKRLNPRARLVYRVSDDIRLLRNHRTVLATEERVAPRFDRVSVPSRSLLERFQSLPQAHLDSHGVAREPFEVETADPYAALKKLGRPQAVFVGNNHLDLEFLAAASQDCPRWDFHVVGPFKDLPRHPNVHGTGELPFAETVPYLKHADVGLMTLRYSSGAEAFTDSLKMQQYTLCRLPIVAPEFLRTDRPQVSYYRPGDRAGMTRALNAALTLDRTQVSTDGISTWADLARTLAGDRA